MRVGVSARGGDNSSGPAGRVMAPAHLRYAEATGGLVGGATPLYRAPQRGADVPQRGADVPQGLRAPRNRLRPIPHLRTNTARATVCSRDDVFGGLRSSIRLGGSKPYRAGSYRLTPESTGLRGKHLIIPGNRLSFAKAQKTSYQKGEGCLGLGE